MFKRLRGTNIVLSLISTPLFLVSFFTLTTAGPLSAQWKNPDWIDYINQYKEIAREQQAKHRIPASITLAQGILESGAGKGRLAKIANNHFGIKCHEWSGPSVRHDDDLRQECFRKYKDSYQSYEDHSIFLTTRPRYAGLFQLDIRDYRGWAFGLSRAGYATDKSYPNKLITIIENYELYEYDAPVKMKHNGYSTESRRPSPGKASRFNPHPVYKSNDMLYIVARSGDDLTSIASELGFSPKKLAKYNEIGLEYPLSKGEIIYLQKKKKKAPAPHFRHIIDGGDSMHSIAQRYGIRLASLYKLNNLPPDYMPSEGDILRLR